jgi:hypothetical protein
MEGVRGLTRSKEVGPPTRIFFGRGAGLSKGEEMVTFGKVVEVDFSGILWIGPDYSD